MKSAVPDEPQQTAKDAVSAAKDALPEAPKDIPNPFQKLFSGEQDLKGSIISISHVCISRCRRRDQAPVLQLQASRMLPLASSCHSVTIIFLTSDLQCR